MDRFNFSSLILCFQLCQVATLTNGFLVLKSLKHLMIKTWKSCHNITPYLILSMTNKPNGYFSMLYVLNSLLSTFCFLLWQKLKPIDISIFPRSQVTSDITVYFVSVYIHFINLAKTTFLRVYELVQLHNLNSLLIHFICLFSLETFNFERFCDFQLSQY